jgi:hypothetical protein
MSWFSTVAQNVEQGFDWGVTATSQAANSAAKAGSYVAGEVADTARWAGTKTVEAANYAYDQGVAAGKYAADKAVAGAHYAYDKGVAAGNYAANKAVAGANYAVDKSVAAAKYTAQAASASASYVGDQVVSSAKWAGNKAFERIRSALDDRDSYRLRGDAVQQCPLSRDKHPNPNEGKFMGKDSCPCQGSPELSDEEPSGVFPEGCGPGCGKPKIYFTNGINNTEEDLCKTISALAESQCAEVVGIYNATYADKRLEGKGAGMLNDVADCMDAIDESGKSAAAVRMKDSLVADLQAGKKPVKVFAHSEGGLNTQTALREAQKKLASQRLDQLVNAGIPDEDAIAAADHYATKMMGNVEVTSFGTAANGWVPGPAYTQYENTADTVPKAIKLAQVARQKGINETNAVRHVEYRGFSGGGLPGHSMTGIYVPMLNEKNAAKRLPNGKCC